MYIHIGSGVVLPSASIIGVFDMDNSTGSRDTVEYLNRAEREGRLINIAEDIPRSFVVSREGDRETVYLCQINTATILKRSESRVFE